MSWKFSPLVHPKLYPVSIGKLFSPCRTLLHFTHLSHAQGRFIFTVNGAKKLKSELRGSLYLYEDIFKHLGRTTGSLSLSPASFKISRGLLNKNDAYTKLTTLSRACITQTLGFLAKYPPSLAGKQKWKTSHLNLTADSQRIGLKYE